MYNSRAITLTIIIAFMLSMIPLPEWASAKRPDLVALVLIYWAMAEPTRVGVTIAWLIGLLVDVSHGAILGQHALGLVIVVYLVHLQHLKLRVASLIQQAIVIFILLLLKQLIVIWVDGIMGIDSSTWSYFVASLVGAMLWPWIYIILRDLRQKSSYRAL